MYDRAARDLTQKNGSTLEHVGPGTYDGNLVDPKRIRSGKICWRDSILKLLAGVYAHPIIF